MRKIYLFAVLIIASCSNTIINKQATPTKKLNNLVSIQFNKNIELVGYIIHLAEPEDNDPEHPITKELSKWSSNAKQPSLHKIYQLGGSLPYELFIQLFNELPLFPLPDNYTIPTSIAKKYRSYTDSVTLSTLILEANQFYKTSNFEKIWSNLEVYRKETLKTLEGNAPSKQLLSTMEEFYQQDYDTYHIVPSLTIWPRVGWGFNTVTKQRKKANFVLGPLNKNFDFSNKAGFENLAIHEFGHSFVNHVVLSTSSGAIKATEKLYLPLKDKMTPQGYNNWETCVIEHFVRAGEILVPELLNEPFMNEALMKDYTEKRKFIYLPFIVDKMRDYRITQKVSY